MYSPRLYSKQRQNIFFGVVSDFCLCLSMLWPWTVCIYLDFARICVWLVWWDYLLNLDVSIFFPSVWTGAEWHQLTVNGLWECTAQCTLYMSCWLKVLYERELVHGDKTVSGLWECTTELHMHVKSWLKVVSMRDVGAPWRGHCSVLVGRRRRRLAWHFIWGLGENPSKKGFSNFFKKWTWS